MFKLNAKKIILSLSFVLVSGVYAADELTSTRAAFAKAIAERDLDAIAQIFDEEGILVNQDGSLSKGREQIKAGFKKILENENVRIKSVPDSSITIQNGDLVLRSGRWQLVDNQGNVQEEWFASEVFRKNEKGEWLYLIDNPYNKLP